MTYLAHTATFYSYTCRLSLFPSSLFSSSLLSSSAAITAATSAAIHAAHNSVNNITIVFILTLHFSDILTVCHARCRCPPHYLFDCTACLFCAFCRLFCALVVADRLTPVPNAPLFVLSVLFAFYFYAAFRAVFCVCISRQILSAADFAFLNHYLPPL